MSDFYSPKQGIIKTDLALLPEKLLEASEEVVNQVADLIVGYAKINVRVDTGSLRDSIRKERGGEGLDWRLMRVRAGGYITNPKTGRFVDYAVPVEAKYPFLQPALEMAQHEILQLAQSSFAKVVGDAGEVSIEGNSIVVNIKFQLEKMQMSYHELREFEILLRRTLFMLEQSTGSKELKQAIDIMQRAATTARILQFSIYALRAAEGDLSMLVALSGLVLGGVYIGASTGADAVGMQIRGREA